MTSIVVQTKRQVRIDTDKTPTDAQGMSIPLGMRRRCFIGALEERQQDLMR
jgi:hypothetical protein